MRSPVLLRLRELRDADRKLAPRYTQGWLAERVGVDRSLLYRWLIGVRPIPEHRQRQIAALLGMPVEQVVSGARANYRRKGKAA